MKMSGQSESIERLGEYLDGTGSAYCLLVKEMIDCKIVSKLIISNDMRYVIQYSVSTIGTI